MTDQYLSPHFILRYLGDNSAHFQQQQQKFAKKKNIGTV